MRTNDFRARAIATAAGWILIATALATASGLAASPHAALAQPGSTSTAEPQPPATPTPLPSACIGDATKHAFPHTVLLGETLSITLTFRATCPQTDLPLHIVLVLDASGSMAGDPSRQMKDAAKMLIDRLDLRNNPGTKVGVVQFNAAATTLCELTNTASQAKSCVSRVAAEGGTCIDCGIREGLRVLLSGRREAGIAADLAETMVVFADGANNAGCESVLSAARQAKAQGIIMISVCMGAGCDAQCMRQAASSARYFYEIGDAAGLIAVFENIRRTLGAAMLRRLTIVDSLPPNMDLVPDSPIPAADVSPDGRTLTWQSNFQPAEGMTVTFKVRPREVGQHPTNVAARAEFVDGTRAVGAVTYPVPLVQVLAVPGVAPSPTPAPAPPEARPEWGVDAGPLAVGASRRARFSLRYGPPELPDDTHVAIVADASGSMANDNPLLKTALLAMIDGFEQTGSSLWKAAVVHFNSVASTSCALMRDTAALRKCVQTIPASGGTRIDLGVLAGWDALKDGRPSPGHEDLVLFTDGANNAGCSPVLDVAARAKAQGVEVHVVCMEANGCDVACMQQAATSPGHYHGITSVADYGPVFAAVTDRLVGDRRIDAVGLAVNVPPHLELVPGSWSVPPAASDARSARWEIAAFPRGGVDLAFDVEAVDNGVGSLDMTIDAAFARHPAQRIEARSAPITAGNPPSTAPTATPLSTAPSSATPAAAATETPRPTPTLKFGGPDLSRRVFLPVALREACPGRVPVGVVVVLDTSSSMAEQAAGGGTKLEAAVAAVDALAGRLTPADQVALVTFDRTARLAAPLSADPAALRAALGALLLADGTAIDAGLREARLHLEAINRGSSRQPAIVLLTDGRAYPSTPSAVVAEADAARAAGITLHAVGLGREVDARLLASIAGDPARLRLTSGRGDVVAAFLAIAAGCEGTFWSGR